MPSLLVIGADGQIGRHLAREAAAQGENVWETTRRVATTGARRLMLDLGGDMTHWPLPSATIDAAVFCGAVTSTSACADRPEATRAVNVTATAALAGRLAAAGAFVVFLSSNQVFNGNRANAKASDPVDPRTEYGRQKVEAEVSVLGLGDRGAVLRLSKVLTRDTATFHEWSIRLARGEAIEPFGDMVVAPVPVETAVDAVLKMVAARVSGIVQLSADRDLTYAEVAGRLAAALGTPASLVQPVSYRDRGLAFSPQHTTLDGTRIETELHIPRPDAEHVIERYVIERIVRETPGRTD